MRSQSRSACPKSSSAPTYTRHMKLIVGYLCSSNSNGAAACKPPLTSPKCTDTAGRRHIHFQSTSTAYLDPSAPPSFSLSFSLSLSFSPLPRFPSFTTASSSTSNALRFFLISLSSASNSVTRPSFFRSLRSANLKSSTLILARCEYAAVPAAAWHVSMMKLRAHLGQRCCPPCAHCHPRKGPVLRVPCVRGCVEGGGPLLGHDLVEDFDRLRQRLHVITKSDQIGLDCAAAVSNGCGVTAASVLIRMPTHGPPLRIAGLSGARACGARSCCRRVAVMLLATRTDV